MNKITEQFYNNIKSKLSNSPYRISLDIGVGSIGWSIVSLKKEQDRYLPDKLVIAGSRVFPPSEGNSIRREKRLQRRQHRHKRERLFKLWKLLSEKGLSEKAPEKLEKESPLEGDTSKKRFPIDVLRKDVYTLRYKALYEKLELKELGYVIYHIANHRGTSSVRTFVDVDEKKKKEIDNVKNIAKKIKKLIKEEKKYKTYGEYIYKEKIEGKKERERIRNTSDKVEFIITRDLIIEELKCILDKQKEYHGDVLTYDYIEKIIQTVNFEYEKISPDPTNCPYFTKDKKLPRSHPLAEERRLWETINNLRIFEPVYDKSGYLRTKVKRQLNKSEREKVYEVLKKQKILTVNKIKKILNFGEHYEIISSKDKLEGYLLTELEKMDFYRKLKDSNNEKLIDEFFYDWNSIVDDYTLRNILKEKYGVKEEEIDKVMELELKSGYTVIGKKATEILLDYIRNKGMTFGEAIEEAIKDGKITEKKVGKYDFLPYYGVILSDYTQPVICKANFEKYKDRNYKKPETNPLEEKYGRIANPVVHQTLNELRKLINEMIKNIGYKPEDIHIELSRELKKSEKERDNIQKIQNRNEKERKRIFEQYCKPNGLSEKWILKFQLFEEQEGKCPYCLETINVDDIVSSRVDIDHIFPLSESFDNSRNNVLLVHNKCNEEKGQRCPYDAFSKTERWNEILANLEKTSALKSKKWRFMEGSYEEFLNNVPIKERFATDTAYITKLARMYLSCLFDNETKVVPFKGGVTALLRSAWGLNNILIDYIKPLLYEKEKKEFIYDGSKIRLDNRHHAVDAAVLGFCDRAKSNLINKLSARNYKIEYNKKNWLSELIPPPYENFRDTLKLKISEFPVSIKHDHSKTGQLLAETLYRVYKISEKELLCISKEKIINISKDDIEKIKQALEKISKYKNLNSELKKMAEHNEKVLDKFLSKKEEARINLEKRQKELINESKKVGEITDTKIVKEMILMSDKLYYYKVDTRVENKFFSIKNATESTTGFGYDTGDNLCIDLYHDEKGKLCGEIIRKIDAVKKNYEPDYRKKGYKLFERIYQGDILECDVSEDKVALSVPSPNAPKNRVLVRVTTFTENQNGIQIQFVSLLKSVNKGYDSFYITSSMKKYRPRKVILTSMGAIKYRSKILGDKNVENN